MDLWDLRPGDRVRTRDGALAVVLSATEDGEWIRVRYLEAPDAPDLAGTEDPCCRDELMSRTNGERAQGGS